MGAYRSPEGTGEWRRTPRQTLFAETEAEPKGQAGAEVPVLRFVRSGLSARCAGSGMETGASQSGRARGGRRKDRRNRSVGSRCEGISGRNPGLASHQDLHADSGTARLHTESEWEAAAVGHSDGARPGDPDGDPVDPGADLRSRFRGLLLWVPSWPVGPQALEEIRGHVKAGYQAVYDADLKGYFDSIPHDKL